MNLGKFKISNW